MRALAWFAVVLGLVAVWLVIGRERSIVLAESERTVDEPALAAASADCAPLREPVAPPEGDDADSCAGPRAEPPRPFAPPSEGAGRDASLAPPLEFASSDPNAPEPLPNPTEESNAYLRAPSPLSNREIDESVEALRDDDERWNAIHALGRLAGTSDVRITAALERALDSGDFQQRQLAAYALYSDPNVGRTERLAAVAVEALADDALPRGCKPVNDGSDEQR
jgi:hypothetical protein